MADKEQLASYLSFVEPFYSGKDPAHNFQHIQRIAGRLVWLSQGVLPPPEPHRLYFLACFHGLGNRMLMEDGLRAQTRAFLTSLEWSEGEIDASLESLARHLRDPQTVEEKIVHDANYVETLGAFGIVKAFTTGGAHGQSIEQTLQIFERDYLDQVVFQTPAGKRFADEKRSYTKAFLKELKDELGTVMPVR